MTTKATMSNYSQWAPAICLALEKQAGDSDIVARALDAIESGDSAAALEILREWILAAASAPPDDADAQLSDEPGAEDDGAEGIATPSPSKKVLTASQAAICRSLGCSEENFLRVRESLNRPLVRRAVR